MRREAKGLFWICLIITCFSPLIALSKPTAPVSIEYATSKDVKGGDEVSSVIRFIAQTDLERLEVSFSPYEGLELILGKEKTVFENIKKGEARELEVSIKLTDPEIGYLSVFATTVSPWGTRTKAIAIRYGAAGPQTNQKLKSINLIETREGEGLILLPGDRR